MYGLNIKNDSGVSVLSSTDMTWNVVHSMFCDVNSSYSGNIAVPQLTEFKYIEIPLYDIPDDQASNKATVSIGYANGVLSYSVVTTLLDCQLVILGR